MRRFIQDKGRNEKPQVWEITCAKNSVHTMWGQQGGAMQQTTQSFEAVNVGKANEKSPDQVAQEFMDRLIKKKEREGYYEVDLKTNKPLQEASKSEIDFVRLPGNLRFFKPQNSMNAHCTKLVKSGQALMLRKRDGMMHVITVGLDGEPRMYGSNMLINHKDEPGIPWMDRYPHIYTALKKMELPPKTILLGELVNRAKDQYGFDRDDFQYVGSVIKSLTPRALELQKAKGPLGYCIWDIAFWQGRCLLHEMDAERRFEFLGNNVLRESAHQHITMPEIVILRPDTKSFYIKQWDNEDLMEFEADDDDIGKDVLNWAKGMKWEGFVVVDPESTYGDRAFNFHGKAERPKEVCKMKPTLEADFIARWDPKQGIGEFGKGKKSGGIGAVALYLWDPETGKEVYICDCGGGLTDEQVHAFANVKRWPKVWKVEFNEWSPKGALRFPVFLSERDDKTLEECELSQRPVAEDEE